MITILDISELNMPLFCTEVFALKEQVIVHHSRKTKIFSWMACSILANGANGREAGVRSKPPQDTHQAHLSFRNYVSTSFANGVAWYHPADLTPPAPTDASNLLAEKTKFTKMRMGEGGYALTCPGASFGGYPFRDLRLESMCVCVCVCVFGWTHKSKRVRNCSARNAESQLCSSCLLDRHSRLHLNRSVANRNCWTRGKKHVR